MSNSAPVWSWQKDRLVCQHPRGARAELMPWGTARATWATVCSDGALTSHLGNYSGEDFPRAVAAAETWLWENAR